LGTVARQDRVKLEEIIFLTFLQVTHQLEVVEISWQLAMLVGDSSRADNVARQDRVKVTPSVSLFKRNEQKSTSLF
jgi:hypothetical protein